MEEKKKTKTKTLLAPEMKRCIGCYSCMLACARQNFATCLPQSAALHIRTRGGMQSGFVADICAACVTPDCAAACPTGAMVARQGGGAIFDATLCNSCGACIKECPIKYLHFSPMSLPVMCKHCGVCVAFCPHECLVMGVTELD